MAGWLETAGRRIKDGNEKVYSGSTSTGGSSSFGGGWFRSPEQKNPEPAIKLPDINTTRGLLARLYQMGSTDLTKARDGLTMFEQLRMDPTSIYYNPFASHTNRALDNLRDMGLEIDEINDEWFAANAWLKQYYKPTANTNSLSSTMTNKRASPEEKAAYYYNQLWMAEESTKKAEQEWAALQKELSYKASQADRPWSDDDLVNNIDWKKYPTLAKMDETRMQGTPMELNRGIGYSRDALYGVIWAARNDGGTGNLYQDMINSALGTGNVYQRDDMLAAKLDPTSDSYAPYTVGSTMDKEREYFGMSSFSKEWIEENRYRLNSADKEERQNYISVLEADAETDLADEELTQFRSRLERKVKGGKDPEQAIDELLESGLYPTLLKMDRSIKNGYVSKTQATVNTTRKVDYDRNSLLEWARGIASEKDGQDTGSTYAESMTGAPQGEKDTTIPKITVTKSEPGEVDAVTGADISTSQTKVIPPSTQDSTGKRVQEPNDGKTSAGTTVQGGTGERVQEPNDEIGQFGKGNIDLWNRPVVTNADGTVSTIRSISIEEDGKTILIPTVVDGKVVSDEEAVQHYDETGEMLGEFNSEKEAQDYADKLHDQQERLYAPENTLTLPWESSEEQGAADALADAPKLAAGEKRFYTFTDQDRKVMRKWGQIVQDGYDMASDAGVLTDTEDAVLSTASAETEVVKEVLNTTPATQLADKSTVKTARANAVSMIGSKAGALQNAAAMEELPLVQEQIAALEGSIVASEDELDMLNMVRDAQPDWLIQDLAKINNPNASSREQTDAMLDIYKTVTKNPGYEYNSSDTEALSKAQAWADYLNSDGPMIETAYSGENRDEDLRRLRAREQELQNTIDSTASDAAAYDDTKAWFDVVLSTYDRARVDTSEIKLAQGVSDYLYSMTIYRPTERTGNSLYQDLEQKGGTPEEIEARHAENHEKLLDAYFVRDQYIPQNGLQVPQDALDGLNREIARLERDEEDWEYYSLRSQPNFEELAAQGQAMEADYVNAYIPGTDADNVNIEATGLNFGLNDAYMSHLLTPEERTTYYYLFARDGADAAHEYYYHLEDQDYGVLTTRSRQEAEDLARDLVNSGRAGGILANGIAVGMAPVEAVAGGLYMLNRLYTGKEYNQDAYMLKYGHYSEATHQATMESILDVNGTPDGKGGKTHNAWSQVVSGLYEIVYNRSRSAANAAVFSFLGGTGIAMLDEFAGAVPMAIGAASMSIADAKKRGASDGQAYAIGTATFFAESLSEAITVSNIKDIFDAEEVTGATIKDAVVNWLTSSGVEEMAGESITDIIENLTDENVMGVLSNHADDVAQYKKDHPGASDSEAEEAVRRNELGNLLHTAIISYLSPGLDVAGTAVRYTGQRVGYYRDVTRDLQERGYNVSIRETRKMLEGANQPTTAQREQRAPQAPAETATTAETETVTPAEAEAVTPANEEAAGEEEKLMSNAAVLESVRGTDAATQNEAIVKVLDPGSGETEFNLANAAAPGLRKLFGGQEGAISGVKAILSGAYGAGEKSELVTAALRNAGTSPSSEARKVIESAEFREATPEQKATMLAATVEADSVNEAVRAEATKSVMEHRVAVKEADAIANGALQGAQPSVDAAKTASRDARAAEAQLEEKQQEVQAAQESLKTAEKVLQNDPREGEALMRDAAQDIRNARTVEEEYTQKVENAKRKEQEAKAKATKEVEQAMDEVRKQATAEVEQEDIARAEQEAQAAEQAKMQAEADEAARVRQESVDNASDADFEAYMEQNNPDATEEEKQHVREIWDRVQNESQQAQAQTEVTPEQMSVEDEANRKKFLRSVGRKFGYKIVEVDEIEHNANGAYDRDTNTIRLNKNATVGDAMYFVLGHELTHITEQAGEYKPLADRLLGMFYGQNVTWDGVLADLNEGRASSPLAREVLNKLNTYQKATGKTEANDYYLQEVVADCMGKLLRFDAQHPEAQQRLVEQLAAEDPSTARKILNGIKRFLKKLVGARGAWQSDMQATMVLFENALKNAKKTTGETKHSIGAIDETANILTDRQGNETAAEEFRGGTVAIDTTRYSLNSFDRKEQAATRRALLDVRDANGKRLYTPEQVDKYMQDALGIASMVAVDRGRLDYDVTDPEKSMVKPNADYGASIDASTLCAKRLLYQGTFDAIQHALPNTPLLPGDLINLANMMREMGYETPCGICYVESRRRTLGQETQKWLNTYEGEYKPKIEELTTSDGLETLRNEHPQAYDDFMEAMKKLNQRNPKVVQLRTEYRGEIKDMTEAAVQKAINHGGLRLQSFSDFETPHLLDMIQVVYDMASKALTSQAYTKVPNFAWAFGDTGIKINLSEIARGAGYAIEGGLSFKELAAMPYEEAKKLISMLYDDVEGMKHDEAMALRNRYGKNVGTIMVGKNDAHIIAAMGDSEIDFIIPFHRSGWTKNERNLMETLKGYQDYTNDQNERKILARKANGKGYKTVPAAKSKIHNFEPVGEKTANGKGRNGYWDFTKSGRENSEVYLKMCEEDGRIPKFSRFLVDNGDGSFSLPQGDDYRSTAIREGYWKTLIDFKMYDNTGAGSPQTAVTPNVNMDQAQRILNDYSLDRNGVTRASNNSLPVAQAVVDRFVEEYKKNHPLRGGRTRYSLPAVNPVQSSNASDADYQETTRYSLPEGDAEAERLLNQYRAAQQAEIDLRDRKKQIDNSDEMKSWVSRMMAAQGDDLKALLAEYKQWETETGYADIANAYEEAKRATKDTSKTYDTYVEQKNVQEEQEKIAASGLSEPDWRRKEAVKEFGYTANVNEAGYMLPNGKMLNFTGEKGKHYGYRGQDHRAIGTIYASREKQFTAAMNAFMNDGNIRLMPESPGIDLSNAIEPTPEQYSGIRSMIRSLANKEYFSVDFSDQNGNNIGSLEYEGRVRPDKVVNDIKSFFQTGEVPQQSSLDRFRYSLPSDAPYMAAVERGELDQAQQMVDEKAREAGYDTEYVAWRGDSAPYNVLEAGVNGGNLGSGLYFTPDRSYAERFASRNSPVRKFYLKTDSTFNYDDLAQDFNEYAASWLEENDTGERLDTVDEYTWSSIWDDFISENGYDSAKATGVGGISYGAREIAVQNSWQAKLADPVTYDDQGNIIPLSERFNTNNDDIRYSIPDDTVLEQQIRQYLANGGSLNDAPTEFTPVPDRPQKQRQYGSARAENIPLWHEETIRHLKENSGYDPDTNAEQVDRAFSWIQSHATEEDPTGYYGAVAELESPEFNFATADGQARMIITTAMASVKAHDGDPAAKNDERQLNDLFNRQGTTLAQAFQARQIYFMLTPETKQNTFQREIDKINEDYKKKGKDIHVALPKNLMDELTNAKNSEELEQALDKARKNIASQMPANWKEKLQAWRMFAMLGNPRTHIRNILGNAVFMPAIGIKNKIGAVGEILSKQETRTKTIGLASPEARAFAKADASTREVKSLLTGDKKYSEGSKIQQERKMFGQGSGLVSKTVGKTVQALSDFSSTKLEQEDWIFLSRHYRNALAGYMTANKLTAEDMKGQTLVNARTYAVQEAKKATYRDANAVADWLNNISNPAVKFAVNAALPFKKTPANILKRGIEYSPVGLIDALSRGRRQLKSGKISANEFIDRISSGVTGTAIAALGAALSSLGAVTTGLDDDDDEFKKLQGEQEYAINPGKTANAFLGRFGVPKIFGEDVSYTVDWAAPLCMPFFVGAAIMDTYKKQTKVNVPGVLDAILSITEPVWNLSMLDGVNSLLETSQNVNGNAFTQVGEKLLTNYATSYVPTFVGQVARTIDTTRRKSYVESGAEMSTLRYALEGLENKLPYFSTKNIPYRDLWGNPDTSGQAEAAIENFISPGYGNMLKNDPVVTELERIYQADGLTDEERKAVIPKAAGKTISGMKLNAEQYDQYVVSRGQTARDTLEALMESEYWQICDDPTRAKMVSEAWTYANQLAQHELTGRKLDGWVLESGTAGNVVQNIVSRAADDNKKAYIAGYGQGLAEALDADNNEDFELCLTALEDADATPAEIRTHLRNYFKPRYQSAYMAGDEDTMYDIQEKLLLAGVGFKPKDFNSWTPGEPDEEEFDTSWLGR